jgi:hypothetical protein
MDGNFPARDDTDAGYRTGSGTLAVIVHVGSERGKFKEWCSGVKQHLHPFARQHLSLLLEAIKIAQRPLAAGCELAGFEFSDDLAVVHVIKPKIRI